MLMFRVDDFPYTKPEEKWRHNLDNFKMFDEIMEKHGISYTLGVIPFHTTNEMLKFLSSSKAEVAMHGIRHDERFQNEFREHQTKQDIVHAIRSIKDWWDPLVGPVDSYIPPHNCIDTKTIDALNDLGFKKIFGGPGTDKQVFDYAGYKGLKTYYSSQPFMYGRSDEIIEKMNIQGFSFDKQSETPEEHFITLHWTWEMNIGLSNLDQFLTRLLGTGLPVRR